MYLVIGLNIGNSKKSCSFFEFISMRCVDAVTAIALHAYETEHMETIFF